jgi:hypothetical protein
MKSQVKQANRLPRPSRFRVLQNPKNQNSQSSLARLLQGRSQVHHLQDRSLALRLQDRNLALRLQGRSLALRLRDKNRVKMAVKDRTAASSSHLSQDSLLFNQ